MGRGNFLSHTDPDGSTCAARNSAAGYRNWCLLAENLAAGYEKPRNVVQGWMKSPGHRANILSPDLREIGVGHAYVKKSYYGHYWVQEFGARRDDQPKPVVIARKR
jgi:uncharacterized protein YkwD